jgi:hypothetical protein
MWPEDCYSELLTDEPRWNVGNCKRCVNRSSCGNKNKKEASWCDKYRPEIKNKRKKKKR